MSEKVEEIILTDEDIALIEKQYTEIMEATLGGGYVYYPTRENYKPDVMRPIDAIRILVEYARKTTPNADFTNYESELFYPKFYDPISNRLPDAEGASKDCIQHASDLMSGYIKQNYKRPTIYKGQLYGTHGKQDALYTGIIVERDYHDYRGRAKKDVKLLFFIGEKEHNSKLASYWVHDFDNVDQAKDYFRKEVFSPVGRCRWRCLERLDEDQIGEVIHDEIHNKKSK